MKVVPAPSERCTIAIGWLPITLPPLSAVIEGSFQFVIRPWNMPHRELRERRNPPAGIVRLVALNGTARPFPSKGTCTIGPRCRLYPDALPLELLNNAR